ncbi:MAG: NAD(P)-binding domain-containing protein, partial [Miltoncostaeaceae bacterium]
APDRPSEGIARALAAHPGLTAAPAPDAVGAADAVLLCTPFAANADALAPVAGALAGRVLVDCTNPVGPGLRHGLDSVRAGAEQVAGLAAGARVVKAFSVYGVEVLAGPRALGTAPAPMMPLAGDDPDAVALVAGLAADMGWDPLPVGPLAQALHLEHMTLLWVRMVRAGGHPPLLAWAALGG